ncbi:hypothetical protein [Mesorhizobium waimense]|nr:hypothetical protein [Mesorhizobium waimense]
MNDDTTLIAELGKVAGWDHAELANCDPGFDQRNFHRPGAPHRRFRPA